MIQLTPHIRIFIYIGTIDFRKGIDGMLEVCRTKLSKEDVFMGNLYLFRSRNKTTIRMIIYDGQGFWLLIKRLSKGTFKWWPTSATAYFSALNMYELQTLIGNGNPDFIQTAKEWRPILEGQ